MPTSPSSPNPCAHCHLKTACPEPSTQNRGLCKCCTETPGDKVEREEKRRWTQRKGLVIYVWVIITTPVLGCELGHRNFTQFQFSLDVDGAIATQKRKSRKKILLENHCTELILLLWEATASQPKGHNEILSQSLPQAPVHQAVQSTAMKLHALELSSWDGTPAPPLPQQHRFSLPYLAHLSNGSIGKASILFLQSLKEARYIKSLEPKVCAHSGCLYSWNKTFQSS